MDYLSGDDFLNGLPLLIAGPVLRRTEPAAVTVWVALKHPCTVRLNVLDTQAQGQRLGDPVLMGQRPTTAVGQHLHIVAVTARPTMGQLLACDRIYAYDLEFVADKPYSLTEALHSQRVPTATVSYFSHQRPTFTLPPQQLDQLKLVHGSCRKPHGGGFDTLPLLDCLLEAAAGQHQERPHQLFLTGDQVYGDDVAAPLQWVATALGDTLLGWEEHLPIETGETLPSKRLPTGKRGQIATHKAGFTAGLNNKHEKISSHFLSFGEYCALYLLERSPVCWPVDLPAGQHMAQDRQVIRRWNRERRHMQQFRHTLWKVRRALANVSTYTVFDDHDVSDDWNLNQKWCLRVLGRPLGRRAVQNALAAYGIFQAWGNTPWQFESDQPGQKLLGAVERWSASGGQDQTALNAIATYVGLPTVDPHTGLPTFTQENDVWVLQRSDESLKWDYTVYGPCHEVLALDTRTVRGYPINKNPDAPPMLLSPSAFQHQLSQPLSHSASPYKTTLSANQITFVIASTNVISMQVLDWIQAWQLKNGKVFAADVGDSWNLHDRALATLLVTLFEQRQAIVVLSGDIHFSSAVRLSHSTFTQNNPSVLIQLVSSAIKNEELLTQILHSRLKQWLLPEKSRQWAGWSTPPDMTENPSHDASNPPRWRCQTWWLERQKAEPVLTKTDLFWLIPPRSSPRNSLWERLKFWNTRWFQDGREAVGFNNIALVHFRYTEDSSITVMQDCYWFSSWQPIQIMRSRFEDSLSMHQLTR